MRQQFKEKQTLKVTVVSRVSAHGDGLYLYIPKDVIDVYGIAAGDKIEVQFLRQFKPVVEAAAE